MDNSESILAEILSSEGPIEEKSRVFWTAEPQPDIVQEKKKASETAHSQWAVLPNGKFAPVGQTIDVLDAGVYGCWADMSGYGVEKLPLTSDGIYTLPDMATEQVLTEIHKFWASEDKYRKHNLLYKRGLLLWGPPGGGKTVTVKLLMSELVSRGGIVIVVQNVNIALSVLKAFRRIEPTRNLITVYEDIDEIIAFNGESQVLSMLDGEHNIDNILQLATTNYPENLGARIINRPSRFDRRVYVGMPEAPAREAYLMKATQNGLDSTRLNRWVKDTEGLSIAHLRELVAAVYCLDQDYEEVVDRLKAMAIQPKGESGFGQAQKLGFSPKRRSIPQPTQAQGSGWVDLV